MPDTNNIKTTIVNFLIETGNISEESEISDDTNLLSSGTLDSVNIVRLIAHIESQLGVRIPPKDLIPKNFITIDAMTAYLRSKVDQTRPAET